MVPARIFEGPLPIAPASGEPDTEPVHGELKQLLHWTRNWLHYGWLALIVVCCVVAAVEGLLGR